MGLQELLTDNWDSILNTWIDRALATYPAGGGATLKREKDRFANPLGHAITSTLTGLYRHIGLGAELEPALNDLEHLIQIRAVQDFTPAEAVSIVYLLKEVVAEECRRKKKAVIDLNEWMEFDRKVEAVGLRVFELYLTFRERIYQVKLNDYKRGTHMVTEGGGMCPSALMRRNQKTQTEIEPINQHDSHEAR